MPAASCETVPVPRIWITGTSALISLANQNKSSTATSESAPKGKGGSAASISLMETASVRARRFANPFVMTSEASASVLVSASCDSTGLVGVIAADVVIRTWPE